MKKVFKNNRIIVGLCGVLLAAGVCIGTNHYMISDSAGSVAAESQKADPLTRLAAAAEQDFDILEEEQESDNSPGWHTETQGSKTYKYYNNSAGNRLKGYRKIKKDYYFFSQKSGYAVCNGWKYVRIKGKKYKLYFDKKGRRSDPTKKLGSKARYQIRVSLRDNMVTIYAKDGAKGFIIPVKAMVQNVREHGLPCHVSFTAGTYVCNCVMYNVLHLCATKYPNIRAGFIHVPFACEQVVGKASTMASMPLETIAKSLEYCIEAVVTNKEEVKEAMGTTH